MLRYCRPSLHTQIIDSSFSGINQYLVEIPEGSYTGTLQVSGSPCYLDFDVPGLVINVTQDPSDPTKGTLSMGNIFTNIAIESTDAGGNFEGTLTGGIIPATGDSGPDGFVDCQYNNVTIIIKGTFTANAVTSIPGESKAIISTLVETPGNTDGCNFECPEVTLSCLCTELENPGSEFAVGLEFEAFR